MTAVNLMGAMTEDSWRGRERNTVYKPSATYPQGREGGRRGGGGGSTPLPPCLFLPLPLSLSMIVVCLLACFFIRSHSLFSSAHNLFYNLITFLSFPMIEYLTMQQFSHFISALCLRLWVHCGRAWWGRSTEKSRRGP